MGIKVLNTGELTPQQIFAGTLEDLEEFNRLIIIGMDKEGCIFINHSHMTSADLVLGAAVLQSMAVKKCIENV